MVVVAFIWQWVGRKWGERSGKTCSKCPRSHNSNSRQPHQGFCTWGPAPPLSQTTPYHHNFWQPKRRQVMWLQETVHHKNEHAVFCNNFYVGLNSVHISISTIGRNHAHKLENLWVTHRWFTVWSLNFFSVTNFKPHHPLLWAYPPPVHHFLWYQQA